MMNAEANDVCLAAHFMANIASLRHKVAQHHFERSEEHHIAVGDASFIPHKAEIVDRPEPPQLKYLQSCGTMKKTGVKMLAVNQKDNRT